MGEFEGKIKAGEVRNPSGNNGRTPITDCIMVLLKRGEDELDDKPLNNAQKIALEWAKKAKAGELAAITSLTERVEGKPVQPMDHTGNVVFQMTVNK